jgi:tetratricopeptide (TPR) repeat protein
MRLEQLFSFLQADANDTFTLYSIAYEYMQLQDFPKSVEYFERLRAVNPQYTGLYYHLGIVYEKMGQADKGMEIFQKGIEVATAVKDLHALSELKNIYQNREMGIED